MYYLLQAIHDSKILVFTLWVREITEAHTGKNFKNMILEELAKFGIRTQDIYSITFDSGSNIKKSTKLVDAYFQLLRFGEALEYNKVDDDRMEALVKKIAKEDWDTDRIFGESASQLVN